MKRATIELLLFAVLFQSCIDDDCKDIACFTPPEFFEFEIVDATTKENVFTNGTYSQVDIKLINSLDNNSPVEYSFISENNSNIIQTSLIGWSTEIVNLELSLSDTPIFELYIDAERKNENCCSFTEYKEITLSGVEYQIDSTTGVYTVFIE